MPKSFTDWKYGKNEDNSNSSEEKEREKTFAEWKEKQEKSNGRKPTSSGQPVNPWATKAKSAAKRIFSGDQKIPAASQTTGTGRQYAPDEISRLQYGKNKGQMVYLNDGTPVMPDEIDEHLNSAKSVTTKKAPGIMGALGDPGEKYINAYKNRKASEDDRASMVMDALNDTSWEGLTGKNRLASADLDVMIESAEKEMSSMPFESAQYKNQRAYIAQLKKLKDSVKLRSEYAGQFSGEDDYVAAQTAAQKVADYQKNGQTADDAYQGAVYARDAAEYQYQNALREYTAAKRREEEIDDEISKLGSDVDYSRNPEGELRLPDGRVLTGRDAIANYRVQRVKELQAEKAALPQRIQDTEKTMQTAAKEYQQATRVAQYAKAYQYSDLENQADWGQGILTGQQKLQEIEQRRQSEHKPINWDALLALPASLVDQDTDWYSPRLPTDDWNQDQKNNFLYLLGRQGEDVAFQYAIELNAAIRGQNNQDRYKTLSDFAPTGPLGRISADAMSVAGLFTSPIDYYDQLKQYIRTGQVLPSEQWTPFGASRAMNQAVVEDLNSRGTLDPSIRVFGGKGLGDAWQLKQSIINSISAVKVFGALAGEEGAFSLINSVFYTSSAVDATNDALAKGSTPEQAVLIGASAGAAEVIGESFSIDRLLHMKYPVDAAQILWNIATQAGIEGSEEGVTNVINRLADKMVYGDKSELQQDYRNNLAKGMSSEEAEKAAVTKWAESLAFDVFGGFISGGVSAGGNMALMPAAQRAGGRAYAGMTRYQGDTQGLMDQAKAAGGQAAALAQQYQQRGGRFTNLDAYKLDQATRDAIHSADRERLIGSVEQRLMDQGERYSGEMTQERAHQLAEGIVKLALEGSKTGETGFTSSLEEQTYKEMVQQLNGTSAESWLDTTGLKITQNRQITEERWRGVETEDGGRARIVNAVMENGQLKLNIEQNGETKTVTQDQVKLNDYQKGALHTLTEVLGEDAAAAYNGMRQSNLYSSAYSIRQYAMSFGYIRDLYGAKGASLQAALASRIRGRMTDAQVQQAYNIGQQRGERQEQARPKSRRGTGKVTLDGGTIMVKDENGKLKPLKLKGVENRNFTEADRKQLKIIQTFAKALHIDVAIFQSETDKEGNITGKQEGAYYNGTIYLDWYANMKNAKNIGERMLLRTMAHELTHFIQQNASGQYQVLKDFIIKYLADNYGSRFNALVMKKMEETGLSQKEAEDEVIADACETMLRDSKAVHEMAQTKPKLYYKVRAWIHDFLSTITAEHEEAKALKPVMREIQELWDAGLREAVSSRTRNGSQTTERINTEETTETVTETVTETEEQTIRAEEQTEEAAEEAEEAAKEETEEAAEEQAEEETEEEQTKEAAEEKTEEAVPKREEPKQLTPAQRQRNEHEARQQYMNEHRHGYNAFYRNGGAIRNAALKAAEKYGLWARDGVYDYAEAVAKELAGIWTPVRNRDGTTLEYRGMDAVYAKPAVSFELQHPDAAQAIRQTIEQQYGKQLLDAAAADARGQGAQLSTRSEAEAVKAEVLQSNSEAMTEIDPTKETAAVTLPDGTQYSIRSMRHDIAEGKMFEDLERYTDMSHEEVQELKKNLERLTDIMALNRDILDMNETVGKDNRTFKPFKPNSDPLYTISLDFSTLCRKRLMTQYVIEKLQTELTDSQTGKRGRPLTAEEQLAVRDLMKEYGQQEKALKVACAMCYVEAARLKAPSQIQRFMRDPTEPMRRYFALHNKEFNATVLEAQADFKEQHGYARNAAKSAMKPADVTALNKLSNRLRNGYQMSAEEQRELDIAKTLPNETYLTAANLAKLADEHPIIYDAYTATIRTATRSKSLEADIPYYYGDSERAVSDKFIEDVNRENGMRFSSWSDFQIQHMLDMMTAVIELSTRHCAMHGYTKFLEQVRIFGKTGMMFNMSGVPSATGLKADGSLDFSTSDSVLVYGQDGEYDAVQAREDFPETAGLQCIGMSNAHIKALLASDIMDYIIPYHTSGMNATLRRMAQIYSWDDFTAFQNAKVDDRIKFDPKVHDRKTWHQEPVFSEFFNAAKQESNGYRAGEKGIVTMRRAADLYKQMCRERGMMPKFSWGNSKVDADFSNDPNYWKLLIDRKMINQKTGALIEQKPVRPDFDFGLIEKMVQAEVDAYDPTLQDRALNYVREHLDELPQRISDLKKAGAVKKITGRKTSNAAKTLQAGPVAAVSAANAAGAQLSVRKAAPVQPSDGSWQRGHTEEWFRQNGFPIYSDVPQAQREANEDAESKAQAEQEKRSGGHGTQIGSTEETYRKLFESIKKQYPDRWQNMRVLDASSGLGYGTRAGRAMGFHVTDIEPFWNRKKYDAGKGIGTRPDYEDYSYLQDLIDSGEVEPFDLIISNAVLNVVPQDTRDDLTVAMGQMLKPGGQMFVNVISKDYEGAVKSTANVQTKTDAKGNTVNIGSVRTMEGDYSKSGNMNGRGHETFVWKSNSVQKVFSYPELAGYLRDALGPGYTFEKASLGMTGVMVTKDAAAEQHAAQLSARKSWNSMTEEEREQAVIDNRAFNESQTKTGSPLVTLKGSPISRGGTLDGVRYPVGKVIGGRLYIHKSYADTIGDIDPRFRETFARAEERLQTEYPGFQYNCINYHPASGEVQFQEAPDFDTAREPVVGMQINVQADGTVTEANRGKPFQQIWHHKWQWVGNDYKGFNVRQSWEWSKEWLSTILGASKGGSMRAWNEQLAENGLPEDGSKKAATTGGRAQFAARNQDPGQTLQDYEVEAALFDVLDHAERGDDKLIELGRMPKFVRDLIDIDGDVYIRRNHTYENMVSMETAVSDGRPTSHDGKQAHFHNLGFERMEQAILDTESPVVTWADIGKATPQITMIVSPTTDDGNLIYVAMAFYQREKVNGIPNQRAHVVLTVSDSMWEASLHHPGMRSILDKAVTNDRIISFDRAKWDDLWKKITRANPSGTGNHSMVTGVTDNALTNNVAQVRKEINSFRRENKIDFSMRSNAKTDTELLKKAYQSMLKDKQWLIDQYGKEAQEDLETYQKQAEDYRAKEKEVYDGLQELDRLVREGTDPAAVREQRQKLTAAEGRMTTALKRLAKLQERPALQQILQKEREIERTKTRERIRESVNRKDLRGKIERLWKDLNRRITSPTEKKHIPLEVMQQAIDVLQALNMDTSREGSKAGERLRSKLSALRQRYSELQNDPDFQKSAMYDAQVDEFLQRMIQEVGDTPINQLSAAQMEIVYDTLRALDYTARRAMKLKIGEEERSAYDVSRQMTRETRSVPKPKTGAIASWINAQLSPERMFNRLGGYHKDSMWSKVYRMLDDGQLRQTQLQMEGSLIFDDLLNDQAYKDFVDPNKTVDIGLKDENGNPVPITHGMMVSLWMHLQNEQNRRHVAYGGLTIPGLNDYYNGKKTRGAERATRVGGVLQELAEINDRLQEAEDADEIAELEAQRDEIADKALSFLEDLQNAIEKQMTAYDRAWVTACREMFDGFSKRVLNETTLEVYGIKRANVENYFPIWVDGDFLNTPFETVARDMSLENAGFMKERVDSAKPIRLADVSDVAASQIRKVAQYAGMMPAVRDFNKIWGKTQTGYRDSLQKAVHETFGQNGLKYIENLMADLNGARSQDTGALGEFFNRIRGHMAQAALTLSLRTALGQTASYPTAAAVVGWKALHKAFWQGGRKNRMISRADQELIRKWSPLLYYRMKGYANTELGDIAGMNDKLSRAWKKARWLTGWIQAMDGATVGRLWYAAEYYVQDHNKDLQKGTDAYYEEVAKVFNDIVEKTQPNYSTMQRPDILRNPNALVKQLTMFLTQRLQNFNILYDAAATYSTMKADFKAGRNGVTTEDVKAAARQTRTAVISQVAAAATITAFKFLADLLLHSLKNYRDKDEEITEESVSMELLDMFMDSLAGNVLGGGEVWDLIESKVFGKTYYGIEVSGLQTVTDMIDAVSKVYDHAAGDKYTGDDWQKVLGKDLDMIAMRFGNVAGIPYSNAKKILLGGWYYIQDAKNGEWLWQSNAGVDRTTAQQAHRLYRAYAAMDYGAVNKIREEVGDDDKLDEAVRAYVKQQYKDGEISFYDALRQLQKYGNASDQVMQNFIKAEYEAGNINRKEAENQLVKYGGKTEEQAANTMMKAEAKQETGISYNDIDDLYKIGQLSADDARKTLIQYGIDEGTADMKVEWWSYQKDNPATTMTENKFETYYKKYRSVGMTPRMYEDFNTKWNAVQGVDKNHDGRADSGSKKAERVALIDSLPLTAKQKDELFLMEWAASGLPDTPWHK